MDHSTESVQNYQGNEPGINQGPELLLSSAHLYLRPMLAADGREWLINRTLVPSRSASLVPWLILVLFRKDQAVGAYTSIGTLTCLSTC